MADPLVNLGGPAAPDPAAPDPAGGPAATVPARESATVLVLNGPNLSRLGSREPEIYGSATLADVAAACAAVGDQLGLAVDVRQTDDEAELIGWVHQAADGEMPVVINPAAFTHYSYALRDALAMRTAPLVEVHLSNPAAREPFRHNSVVAGVADGTVAGFGLHSYELALRAVATLMARWP
ncbi:MAG: type II 3-dehydroquinate dehydratase [Streptosporangiaceae bacterium]